MKQLCTLFFNKSTLEKPEKPIETSKLNEEFSCAITENDKLDCSNIHETFNEYGDLIEIKSKNGGQEQINYEYNNGLATKVYNENYEVYITYNEVDEVETITYYNNIKENYKYIFNYDNKEKIKSISKYFCDFYAGNITYEYFEKNNKSYIKEIDSTNQIIYTRIFESSSKPKTALELINYIPKIYLEVYSYLPNFNFKNVNIDLKGAFIPMFSSKVAEYKTTYLNGKEENNKYNLNEFENCFMEDLNNFYVKETKDNKDIVTYYNRNYSKVDEIDTITYDKYTIEYKYKNKKIESFTKYKNKRTNEEEYSEKIKLCNNY